MSPYWIALTEEVQMSTQQVTPQNRADGDLEPVKLPGLPEKLA
jgi:hypothetical protein